MTPRSSRMTNRSLSREASQIKNPIPSPPPLWNHLDPCRREQLAQHLAELIRRIRLQTDRKESKDDE